MSSSFLGSKISLISRSQIRYVGILHSIDPEKSTVSLAQVRSFGTEGRKGNPAEEIPPSDNLFEFIVFRGADVVDLQVFESPAPPPPPPASLLPNDPAIVGASVPQQVQQANNSSSLPTHEPQYSYNGVQGGWNQPEPSPPTPAKPSDLPGPAKAGEPSKKQETVAPQSQKDTPTAKSIEQLAKRVSKLNVGNKDTPDQHTRPAEHPPSQNQRGQSNPRRPSRGGPRRPPGQNHKAPSQRTQVPNSDFDFESANAKFNKEEMVRENESEVVLIPSENFYDKKKSFFDNISCELKERVRDGNEGAGRKSQLSQTERRAKMNEERKLNLETFGQADLGRRRFRKGGGGGGYRRSGGRRGDRGQQASHPPSQPQQQGGDRRNAENGGNRRGRQPHQQPTGPATNGVAQEN
ncbi:uncharacterized protein VTP21DRAFT_9539 [Calcarisporiella thermophila]|uniref:uncharacterized protein n=1 Tax=Calcarisporiella thermophila TaxID=911321 RepID=UPI0037434E3F